MNSPHSNIAQSQYAQSDCAKSDCAKSRHVKSEQATSQNVKFGAGAGDTLAQGAGLSDIGRAKINLSLKILGKRADGFHELESLVVFAAFGDQITLHSGFPFALEVEGPEAEAIAGENLLTEISDYLKSVYGCDLLGRVILQKNLPVAAGLGGGSADAGALIRLAARAFDLDFSDKDVAGFGKKFGADVPVCVASRPALMRGIGEIVTPLTQFPEVGVLLVNPRVAVSTKDVFLNLDAAPVLGTAAPFGSAPLSDQHKSVSDIGSSDINGAETGFETLETLLCYMQQVPNDLTEAAIKIAPVIQVVLAQLAALENCRIARLSGSGATCYGLFETAEEAEVAGEHLKKLYPDWWVVPSLIKAL